LIDLLSNNRLSINQVIVFLFRIPPVKKNQNLIHRFYRDIDKLAASDLPVLLIGETGVGKEVAAKKIHDRSIRKKQPFISVNCSEITDFAHLELFGNDSHISDTKMIGKFEEASGGSIYLDEIDSLSLGLQASILRYLQEKKIFRQGGVHPIKVDVRIFGASQMDLEKALRKGKFNEILYHYLNVLSLYVPPLREQFDQIGSLAQKFLEEYKRDYPVEISGFSDEALMAMMAYVWPGNIRELRKRVRKAVLTSKRRLITPECLGFEGFEGFYLSSYNQALEVAYSETEKNLIQFSLRRPNSSLSKVADYLGISRTDLNKLLIKHRII